MCRKSQAAHRDSQAAGDLSSLPRPTLGLSREACNEGEGDPPLYVNVNMFSGQLMNTWIDSLQAFFPGLQVPAPRRRAELLWEPQGVQASRLLCIWEVIDSMSGLFRVGS